MPDDALIAETNRLLARLLEIQEEQRVEGDRMREESQNKIAEMKVAREKNLAGLLADQSPSSQNTPGDSQQDDSQKWEERREEATRRTQANIDTLRGKDEAYKEEVLREIRAQSELLRQIAARLEQ